MLKNESITQKRHDRLLLSSSLAALLFCMNLISSTAYALVIGEDAPLTAEDVANIELIENWALTDLMPSSEYGDDQYVVHFRGFHTKANACVVGEFAVKENLAPEFKVGIFAEEITRTAIVRYSNGAGGDVDDDAKGIRGL